MFDSLTSLKKRVHIMPCEYKLWVNTEFSSILNLRNKTKSSGRPFLNLSKTWNLEQRQLVQKRITQRLSGMRSSSPRLHKSSQVRKHIHKLFPHFLVCLHTLILTSKSPSYNFLPFTCLSRSVEFVKFCFSWSITWLLLLQHKCHITPPITALSKTFPEIWTENSIWNSCKHHNWNTCSIRSIVSSVNWVLGFVLYAASV